MIFTFYFLLLLLMLIVCSYIGSGDSDHQETATNVTEASVPNLYSVRLYNSPQTSVDRIAIVGVSLYGRLYTKVNVGMVLNVILVASTF